MKLINFHKELTNSMEVGYGWSNKGNTHEQIDKQTDRNTHGMSESIRWSARIESNIFASIPLPKKNNYVSFLMAKTSTFFRVKFIHFSEIECLRVCVSSLQVIYFLNALQRSTRNGAAFIFIERDSASQTV